MIPLGGLHVKHAVLLDFGYLASFALGPRTTTENLARVGQSQDLLDAN
jgi:hypothetical protein